MSFVGEYKIVYSCEENENKISFFMVDNNVGPKEIQVGNDASGDSFIVGFADMVRAFELLGYTLFYSGR